MPNKLSTVYTVCVYTVKKSFSLCDELSLDSVPNEDVHITCETRRLDETEKNESLVPTAPST